MQSVLGTSALNETRLAYVSILTNQNFFNMRSYDIKLIFRTNVLHNDFLTF